MRTAEMQSIIDEAFEARAELTPKTKGKVRKAVEGYFRDLDGEKPCAVYDMVIHCVEKPLLESVLHRVRGNQSHAAAMLGINRNTLRKKIVDLRIELKKEGA